MATVINLTQYFLQGALEGLVAKALPLTAFAYAVNQDGAALNDIIRVPVVSNTSGSSTFTYAAGYTGNGNQVNGKNVTLGTLLYQQWNLTDSDIKQLNPESMRALGAQAGARLGSDVVSASIAATVTTTNFAVSSSYTAGQFTGSAANTALIQVKGLCDAANWGDTGRVLVASPTLYNNILTGTNIQNASYYGNAAAIQAGQIPQIFGFTPYLVTCALARSFVAVPSAMAVGMAYHAPSSDANLTEAMRMVDQKTGITMGYRAWYDADLATTKRVIDVLFGSALCDGTAAITITP